MKQNETSVESYSTDIQPFHASQVHKLSQIFYQTSMNYQHFLFSTQINLLERIHNALNIKCEYNLNYFHINK